MSKGGGSQTTTQRNDPAEFIAPYYSEAAKAAQGLYKQGAPAYFPGSTFVPNAPETELALQAATTRAIGGSPLTQGAQDQSLKTIQGGYLSGSEFLRPQLEAEYARIGGNVNSQFAKGGAYGSSANQEVLAREQMKAANQALGANYERERQLQAQAISGAPAMAQADYYDIGALSDVGQQRQDLYGRQLQDQMERYNYNAAREATSLDDYIARITGLGSGFGTTTATQPTQRGSILGTLGNVANLGLGIYSGGRSLGLFGAGR